MSTMSETDKDKEDREYAARIILIKSLRKENVRLKRERKTLWDENVRLRKERKERKAEENLLAEVMIVQDFTVHRNHRGTPPAA